MRRSHAGLCPSRRHGLYKSCLCSVLVQESRTWWMHWSLNPPDRHHLLPFHFDPSHPAGTSPQVLRALDRVNHEVTAKHLHCNALASGVVFKTHASVIADRIGSSLHQHVCVFNNVSVDRHNEAPYFCRDRPLGKDHLCEHAERLVVLVVTSSLGDLRLSRHSVRVRSTGIGSARGCCTLAPPQCGWRFSTPVVSTGLS